MIPRFTSADKSDFLLEDDLVIGIVHQGIAKAYPLLIMNYHEVINDQFGDEHVVVTYSPLTASVAAFAADIDGKVHTFGVSGLLYNNNPRPATGTHGPVSIRKQTFTASCRQSKTWPCSFLPAGNRLWY